MSRLITPMFPEQVNTAIRKRIMPMRQAGSNFATLNSTDQELTTPVFHIRHVRADVLKATSLRHRELTVSGAATAPKMDLKNVTETLQRVTSRTAPTSMIVTSGVTTVLPENILIIIMSTVPDPALGVWEACIPIITSSIQAHHPSQHAVL